MSRIEDRPYAKDEGATTCLSTGTTFVVLYPARGMTFGNLEFFLEIDFEEYRLGLLHRCEFNVSCWALGGHSRPEPQCSYQKQRWICYVKNLVG